MALMSLPRKRLLEMTASRPRRVLYVTYNRLSEDGHRRRYCPDKRRSDPPDCEREAGKEYLFCV